ncbi:cardioacceleratory peptide receptor-like isoform X2 [Mytilus californianus]|uniref:cardioacceleratory peptide receptor-like isoform X2 n=1 Tax=Mytilus californianus TaxID=6549 RepID=UPI0022477674|nr:cardioacceleratory peptide receptor-like isoform X2 [Mytilus californianus]
MAVTDNITVNLSIILNKATESSIEIMKYKDLKWISLTILLGIIFLNIVVVVLLISRKPKSRMRLFVANLAIAASKGKQYRYGMALSAWVIGCILAIPYGVFGEYSEEDIYCLHVAPILIMLYMDLCTIIIIPLIIICVCYIIVIIKIRGRERDEFILDKNKDSDNDCDIELKHKAATKAKIRTIKLLCVVVFAYIICWSPITIAAIVLHYRLAEYGLWFMVLYLLAPLNSLANPLVFLIFNQKMFRRKKKKGFSRTTFNTDTQRVTLCS